MFYFCLHESISPTVLCFAKARYAMELTLHLNENFHDMLFLIFFFYVCTFATLATLALKAIDRCKLLKKEKKKAMLVYIYLILV